MRNSSSLGKLSACCTLEESCSPSHGFLVLRAELIQTNVSNAGFPTRSAVTFQCPIQVKQKAERSFALQPFIGNALPRARIASHRIAALLVLSPAFPSRTGEKSYEEGCGSMRNRVPSGTRQAGEGEVRERWQSTDRTQLYSEPRSLRLRTQRPPARSGGTAGRRSARWERAGIAARFAPHRTALAAAPHAPPS